MGVPHPRSGWVGGYLIQSRMGGTAGMGSLCLELGLGTSHLDTLDGVPPAWTFDGIPPCQLDGVPSHQDLGWDTPRQLDGVPPARNVNRQTPVKIVRTVIKQRKIWYCTIYTSTPRGGGTKHWGWVFQDWIKLKKYGTVGMKLLKSGDCNRCHWKTRYLTQSKSNHHHALFKYYVQNKELPEISVS